MSCRFLEGGSFFIVSLSKKYDKTWYILLLYSMVFDAQAIYSRTSMARTPLGPLKLVRDRGSSSQ